MIECSRSVRTFVAGLIVSTIVTPAFGQSNAGEQLELSYQMAFWGIPFGHTSYNGLFLGNDYSAKAHFETSGLVSTFWKSTIDATAGGKISPHTLAPAVYDSYSENRNNKVQRVKVSFEIDSSNNNCGAGLRYHAVSGDRRTKERRP